jgi:hypothetical protein
MATRRPAPVPAASMPSPSLDPRSISVHCLRCRLRCPREAHATYQLLGTAAKLRPPGPGTSPVVSAAEIARLRYLPSWSSPSGCSRGLARWGQRARPPRRRGAAAPPRRRAGERGSLGNPSLLLCCGASTQRSLSRAGARVAPQRRSSLEPVPARPSLACRRAVLSDPVLMRAKPDAVVACAPARQVVGYAWIDSSG